MIDRVCPDDRNAKERPGECAPVKSGHESASSVHEKAYRVTVTREITESATISVLAATAREAVDRACQAANSGGFDCPFFVGEEGSIEWDRDACSEGDAYIIEEDVCVEDG